MTGVTALTDFLLHLKVMAKVHVRLCFMTVQYLPGLESSPLCILHSGR